MLFFIFVDMLWIGYLGNGIYRDGYGDLLRKTGENISPNWFSAFFVYTLCVFGLLFFVTPLSKDTSVVHSILYGGIYGLIMYGFYNFTNHAVFSNWSLYVAIIDTVWLY